MYEFSSGDMIILRGLMVDEDLGILMYRINKKPVYMDLSSGDEIELSGLQLMLMEFKPVAITELELKVMRNVIDALDRREISEYDTGSIRPIGKA